MAPFSLLLHSSLLRGKWGQGLAEYALVLALIAIVAATFLSGQGDVVLSRIGKSL